MQVEEDQLMDITDEHIPYLKCGCRIYYWEWLMGSWEYVVIADIVPDKRCSGGVKYQYTESEELPNYFEISNPYLTAKQLTAKVTGSLYRPHKILKSWWRRTKWDEQMESILNEAP